VQGCQMMSYRSFQTFFIKRGIMSAKSMGELNRYWKKALVSYFGFYCSFSL
jgi:hypothetical protein